MKILHIGDCHLDSALETDLSPSAAKTRRGELLMTFKDILAAASRGGARLCLLAGDLFDTATPAPATVSFILGEITAHDDILFLLIEGNHDAGALEKYELPENLRLVKAGETNVFRLDEGVTVYAAGYGAPFSAYEAFSPKENDKNILLAHGAFGTQEEKGGEIIPRAIIEKKPFDYIALGHYHSHRAERINMRATACYAGIPEGRGFDETGVCGVVFLDSETMRAELIPSARRTLHRIRVDISRAIDNHDAVNAVYEQISALPDKDMVHVTLCGHYTEKLHKDLSPIEAMLARFYFFRLKDESLLALRPEDYKNDISLRGEFVRRVLDLSLSEEDRSRMLDFGLRALVGEDPIQ